HPFSATPKLNALPRIIANDIERIFGLSARDRVVFHVNGADCNEKQRARRIRGARAANAMTAANNTLPAINYAIKPPSKSKEAEFKKQALKTFRFDPSLKTWLATSLTTLGFRVHQCAFEADVCIAATSAASTCHGERIAISADSDFQIYAGIPTVLRPLDHRCTTWARYDKNTVLGDFKFTHPEQMVLYSVVNRNDYDDNVQHQGLARNRATIIGLPSSTSAPSPTLFSSLLTEYLAATGAPFALLANSVQVFSTLQRTPLVGPPAAVHPNQAYVDLCQRARGIPRWRNAYAQLRAASTSMSSGSASPSTSSGCASNFTSSGSGSSGQAVIAGAAASRKPNLVCLQNNLAWSGLQQNQANQVKERMQQTVVMVNIIVQRLYFATALLVTALTNGDPRLARSVHVDKKSSESYLKAITGSPVFVYLLTCRLYQGNSEIPSGQEASDAAFAAYHAFRLFQVEAGKVLTPLKSSHPIYIGGTALDLAVQHVFTAIRSHYENANFLGVDADPNSSVIQMFFALNAKEKRYKDFPKAKFTPSSITLTEDGLSKGLGIVVVKVKEEYTSKKCPRPNCSQDLDHIRKDRSAWCPNCQMYFDRDVVGGENI
ncbi:hypothetical protein KVV02_007148, partial [Mortierella alpina]